MIVPQQTEQVYMGHFRMSRQGMLRLDAYCEEKSQHFAWGGEEPMSMYEMVHITIWFLANKCFLRLIGDKFDRTVSSIWRAIDRVTTILEVNQSDFIAWPTLEDAHGIIRYLKT